jgi:acylphosphatase
MHGLKVLQAALLRPSCLPLCYGFTCSSAFACFCYNVAMISRAYLLISGRVQGVCYRAFTQNQAIKLGLGGWVKNMHDGRVEAVLEGQRELIEQAILACKSGPSGSRVSDIEITWGSPQGEEGFEIRF